MTTSLYIAALVRAALPAPPGPLIGRGREVAALRSLLTDGGVRLLMAIRSRR